LPRVREQHRAPHAVGLFLDRPDQRLKGLLKWRAAGKPVEYVSLAFQQGGAHRIFDGKICHI
jgi:hypothetical protein